MKNTTHDIPEDKSVKETRNLRLLKQDYKVKHLSSLAFAKHTLLSNGCAIHNFTSSLNPKRMLLSR